MSIVDYYAVNHRTKRAVFISDDKGNRMNRACWRRFLVESMRAPDDEIVLVPDWEVPPGYEPCGGAELGGYECRVCGPWIKEHA